MKDVETSTGPVKKAARTVKRKPAKKAKVVRTPFDRTIAKEQRLIAAAKKRIKKLQGNARLFAQIIRRAK